MLFGDEAAAQAQKLVEEVESGSRHPQGWTAWFIPILAFAWSAFQFSLPDFIIVPDLAVLTIHLAFALSLAYLSFPMLKKVVPNRFFSFLGAKHQFYWIDYLLAGLAAFAALYLMLDYAGIGERAGSPILRDIIVGFILIVLLLEAARRTLGPVMPLVALFFILYAFLGPHMPEVIAFKGVSLNRLIGQVTVSNQGIYGTPLQVAANTVFLFVLFGALLEKVGAGRYFVDLAFSVMGGFKGGPAKASILASACSGMISGSSVANTVTVGTFTIPLMKKAGMPAHKAAAIEVAASVNGQLTPPVMGAAAFIIAEYTGLSYFDVCIAAIIPAFITYAGLFYIVHLEASKLGIRGLPRQELPPFFKTLLSGLHYWIPLCFLIYVLVVLRRSPEQAAFYAIILLLIVIVLKEIIATIRVRQPVWSGLWTVVKQILSGFTTGARNMIGIGIATATAGIIVAVVNMGLGGLISDVVGLLAGGNLVALLFITAGASIILGMGLPTTANYIVMATLTAPLIVKLGGDMGLIVPAIAAHLFVFYFGILADDTPPVGLAAYAGAAIAKSDPIRTGFQSFWYDIRTALLPFMFIFNHDLLLLGIKSFWHAAFIFVMSAFGMLAFTAAVQGWVVIKAKWYEILLLLLTAIILFRPELVLYCIHLPHPYWGYGIGIGLFILIYGLQKWRVKKGLRYG